MYVIIRTVIAKLKINLHKEVRLASQKTFEVLIDRKTLARLFKTKKEMLDFPLSKIYKIATFRLLLLVILLFANS